MEKRLLLLPASFGILFAGVTVTPSTDESPAVFTAWVGGNRAFEEQVILLVAQKALAKELDQGLQIRIEVRRGVTRTEAGLP